MKPVVFDATDLQQKLPLLKGKVGRLIAHAFLELIAVNKTNRIYGKYANLKGHHFTHAYFKHVGVNYEVENHELLEQLPQGAFITISNHSYGAIDGMIMIDLMTKIRADYKFLVNDILMHVQTLANNFIGVQPSTSINEPTKIRNTSGIKNTLRHVKEGHPIGFFPAGAVASFYHHPFKLTDKDWQPSIIRLIQVAKVPVIPIYFHGRNSFFFHFLGKIHWQLRSLRMPHEVYNKKKHAIKLTVGNVINVEEQGKFSTVEELSTFLRNKTLELKKGLTQP